MKGKVEHTQLLYIKELFIVSKVDLILFVRTYYILSRAKIGILV